MVVADRSFDRRLEQLVVQRLRDGQAPETLLAELKGRLDDTGAEAILSRAEARIRTLRAHEAEGRGSLSMRVLTGVAYAWTVMLVIQNLTIIWTLPTLPGASLLDDGDAIVRRSIVFAALKIILLGAAFLAFKRWRTIYSTLCYVLAILYAFPIGVIVERLFGTGRPDTSLLLSTSALLSYVAAGLVLAAYLQGRSRAPQRLAVEDFD